jgi:hypothetical protein
MSIGKRTIMNKPSNFVFALVSASLFLLSCEDNNIVKKKDYRPLRIEEVAYKRELVYNSAGQVIRIVSESQMPDRESITTVHELSYSADGNIISSRIDDERLYLYSWAEGRIVKTEEFEQGNPSRQFVFSYQTNGLLKQMLSYKHEGDDVAVTGKTNYTFDSNGNLSSVKEFGFADSGFALESIYEYDQYDNLPCVDSQFDFYTLNIGVKLYKNNPGRMVSKNKNGSPVSIEDYVYAYNPEGYPVKRESTITFLHSGSTGSYETYYFFEEI